MRTRYKMTKKLVAVLVVLTLVLTLVPVAVLAAGGPDADALPACGHVECDAHGCASAANAMDGTGTAVEPEAHKPPAPQPQEQENTSAALGEITETGDTQATPATIAAFGEIPTEYEITAGEALPLPGTLKGYDADSVEYDVPVEWHADPAYEGEAGEYSYAALLASDTVYKLAGGVALPATTVIASQPPMRTMVEMQPMANQTETAGTGGTLTTVTAINAWIGGLTGTGNVLTFVGDIDVNTTINIPANANLTIQSGSTTRTLKRTANVDMIYVDGGTLTLQNIVLDGNASVITNSSRALMKIQSGSATMKSGTIVTNSVFTGINVSGQLLMEGGEISSCGNAITDGGGVIVSGTFTMTGGEIKNNRAASGGGIDIRTVGIEIPVFNMSGGIVTGNTATISGHGIFLRTTTASSNCTITGNAQIGINDSDNGIYINSTAQANKVLKIGAGGLSSGARVNIQGLQSAAAEGSVMATQAGGSATEHSAAYFHYQPGGYEVFPSGNEYVLGTPRTVTLAVNKDGVAWNDHGKTFFLYESGNPVSTGAVSGSMVTFNTKNGTYDLYDGSADTGVDIVVAGADVNDAKIEYYTVSFAAADAGEASGSSVSGTYGGSTLASGSVVPGGRELVLSATGSGADSYTYAWSGTGTSGQAAQSITIPTLAGTVDATCTVTGAATPQSIVYPVLRGDISYNGDRQPRQVVVDAAKDKYVNTTVDGQTVSSVIPSEGSTVITFTAAYLDTLANGTYTVRMNFTDGYAETVLTVNKATTQIISPKTDDSTNLSLWVALVMMAGVSIAGTIVYRHRKTKE